MGAAIFDPTGQQAAKQKAMMESMRITQQAQTDALTKSIAEQPKKIGSDNFLANKAAQLSKLRLGVASTITGAGLPPAASLTPQSAFKAKLGQ